MNRWLSSALTVAAAFAFLVAIIDVFVLRISVEELYAGMPFVYWSYVGQMARAPLALISIIGLGLWLFLRNIVRPLRILNWMSILLLIAACAMASLIAPLASLTQIAGHLERQPVQQHDIRLFYQYQGIATSSCDIVLVTCRGVGLQCRYMEHWPQSSTCLGNKTPAQFITTSQGIAVRIYSETYCCFDNLPE